MEELCFRSIANHRQLVDQSSLKPLASPSVAVSRKEEAWHTLETACTGDKATDRANATRVLGLVRNDVKATKLAEKALADPKPDGQHAML